MPEKFLCSEILYHYIKCHGLILEAVIKYEEYEREYGCNVSQVKLYQSRDNETRRIECNACRLKRGIGVPK